MVSHVYLHLSLVALLVAGAPLSAGVGLRPLPAEGIAAVRAQQPERALRLARSLEAEKSSLGLGALDGIQEYNRITDAYGFTHVRFHQTYRGVEVFNGTILGHMDADGRVIAPHATVQEGIDLPSVTLLDVAKVRAIVAASLPVQGGLWPILVKPVVFPTRYQDGFQSKRDAEGFLMLDLDGGLPAPHKAKPYCWAFRASTMQSTAHGLVGTEFIIDGLTGAVLKKWDGMQHAAPDVPSVGMGESQYSGRVTLNTVQLGDSSLYTLRDTTRATKPWLHAEESSWTEWGGIGSQTVAYDPNGPNKDATCTTPYTNATNTWGNGKPFDWSTDFPGNLFQAIGQTAAADAHYAIQSTWDYYEKVLGRPGGIDGDGHSAISIVHVDDGNGGALANAGWNEGYFLMQYGDGSVTGPLTTLDVAAHEMSHGVMSYTAKLQGNIGEAGGLNEANSDIHAVMVKHYEWGADGLGSVVPDITTKAPGGNNTWQYLWSMGPQLSEDGLSPLRWMYKPILDGISPDAWFEGVGLMDCHYSMGPANRAFFFLSRGASNDASQMTYSEYLPGGMTGIGNDKAIRIWFHGMTTKVTNPEADYHVIREAMIASAKELYPGAGDSDSAETAALRNAFAAVNLGAPAGGKEPVTIGFPTHSNLPFNNKKAICWPAMVSLPLPKPTVNNATDSSVTWNLGGLPDVTVGGRLEDGDKFIAPYVPKGRNYPIKVSSKEDPKRFAVNTVFAISMDLDNDFDTDACDLSALAHDYYAVWTRYPSANMLGNPMGGSDDYAFEVFLEGFNNAFNQ